MNQDELDGILSSEVQVEPSSTFAADVIARVRAEAWSHGGMRFPWIPFLALIAMAAILAIRWFPAVQVSETLRMLSSTISGRMFIPADSVVRNGVMAASASLLCTLILVWFGLRLAESRT